MIRNRLKNKKQFVALALTILIVSAGIFVFSAHEARAADPLGFVDGICVLLGKFLLSVQELVGKLIALLAGLGQGLLNFTKLQNAPIVVDGWRTIRDLVNLFFILILLAIAFASILRIETYGMKKLLPQLIGVALLINFSLVFCGVIIDFSGVLTNFFLQDRKGFFADIANEMGLPHLLTTNADGTTTDTSERKWYACITIVAGDRKGQDNCAAKSFNSKLECENSDLFRISFAGGSCKLKTKNAIQNIQEGKKENEDRVDWDTIAQSDVYWKVISALFLSIIFSLIAAFVFGAFVFLLLVRVLFIWFLLILAPLAWFFWILPETKGLFTRWWSNFIKWVFFAPAAIFFIWLSVKSWLKFINGETSFSGEKITEGMKEVITDKVLQSQIMPQVTEPSYLIQFLLACGMLIGSLIVAQSFGVYGAAGAVGMGKKWSKGLGKGLGVWAGRGARRLATRPADATASGINKASTWLRQSKLGKYSGASWAVGQVSKLPGLVGGKERGAYPKAEAKYKDWSNDNLKARYRLVNSQEKVAIANILAQKGALEANDKLGFSENDIIKATKYSTKYGKQKDILKSRPDLAFDIAKDIDKVGEDIDKVFSGITVKDMDKLQAMSFDKSKVGEERATAVTNAFIKQFGPTGKMGNNHLAKMAEVNQDLTAFIFEKEILKNNFNKFRDDIQVYLKGDLGKSIFGEPKIPQATNRTSRATSASEPIGENTPL